MSVSLVMSNEMKKRIFITGGHITPALAVIDACHESHPDWKIFLIGRNKLERTFAQEKNIDFLSSTTGRASSVIKVPLGFVQALYYCILYRPHVVISFGGYVALPVAVCAYALGIPVITHEQTRVIGLANKIISLIARKICVTFDDQVSLFPKNKTVVTGLPMRQELFTPPSEAPFAVDAKKPIIYITGGSTGAVSLNDLVFPSIHTLTKTYTIIHQTGKLSYQKASAIRKSLTHPHRYIIGVFFETKTVSWILHKSDVIIGRSGANTVMEAAALRKSMVCIPLPWSAGGEQLANAKWLEKRGHATILPQQDITTDAIIDCMQKHIPRSKPMTELPRDGAMRLVSEVNVILDT